MPIDAEAVSSALAHDFCTAFAPHGLQMGSITDTSDELTSSGSKVGASTPQGTPLTPTASLYGSRSQSPSMSSTSFEAVPAKDAMETAALTRSSLAHAQVQPQRLAIIGMACRFPGGVRDYNAFWELLMAGKDGIGPMPTDRWSLQDQPRLVKSGAFLDDANMFDAAFFGFSDEEVKCMDPQHRVLLEVATECVYDAGKFQRGLVISILLLMY